MKRWALGLALFCASFSAYAADVPEAAGFVTDTAGLLPPSTRQSLDDKLTVYNKATTIEIAVLIVPSINGEEPHDYADEVWKKWHIGVKGQDNGVLLLIVPPPEKKAWIQTGYGIQGWLTDTACKHIVTDVMKPLNLQDKRAEAVVAGVDAVIAKLGTTPWAERAKMTPPKDEPGIPTWLIVIVIIVVLFFVLVIWLPGGGFGGGGYYGGGSSSSGGGGGGFSGFGGGDSGGGGGGGDSG